jgi:hypothetical protein
MIDQEFHMVRVPAIARCEDTDAVKLWAGGLSAAE